MANGNYQISLHIIISFVAGVATDGVSLRSNTIVLVVLIAVVFSELVSNVITSFSPVMWS